MQCFKDFPAVLLALYMRGRAILEIPLRSVVLKITRDELPME